VREREREGKLDRKRRYLKSLVGKYKF